ncbi:hypothetical protein I317_01549 [Kwoniella heveanensis CBS 569]|nr:hypothetical protein I317_01549 [Kwoniella heveanensis CBS 569]
MSMNSVVNNLVRAAAGIKADISDADLDAHVAKLLAEEAKVKEMKWSELGLAGLMGTGLNRGDSPDPTLPKTNKRFLASVIRTVDGHNTALLRQQAQSAREARDEKLGESSTGRSRAGSGSAASRLFGGAVRSLGGTGSGISSRSRSDKGKERERVGDDDRHGVSRLAGRRDRDGRDLRERVRERDRRSDDFESARYKDRNDQEADSHDGRRERSDHRDHGERAREARRDRDRDEDENGRFGEDDRPRSHRGGRERERGQSPTHNQVQNDSLKAKTAFQDYRSPSKFRSRSRPPTLSPSSSPPPPAERISKMDKYFTSSYDPRTDLPAVPSEGLIQEVGWDNMLAILKERGQKKRRRSLDLSETDLPAPPPGILPSSYSPSRSASPDTIRRRVDKKERRARREERRARRRRERGKYASESDSDVSSANEERERERERERDRRRRKERKKEKEKEKGKGKEDKKYNGLKKEGGQSGSGILDGYEYVKKGGTRAWDVGK